MQRLRRGLQPNLTAAWKTTAVVILEGLRASGKTVLARELVGSDRYFSFTDDATKQRAQNDPKGWLAALPFGSAIDEAQLVPGITLAAKDVVDERFAAPGQFLLTGSSRIRAELGGTQALAGRSVSLRLRPFSQSELADNPLDTVTALFDDDPRAWSVDSISRQEIASRFSRGGMPTMVDLEPRARDQRLREFAKALFDGSVHHTAKDVAAIEETFRHLSAVSGDIQNWDKLAKATGQKAVTVQGYLGELRSVFLADVVPGYAKQPGGRATKTPRWLVADPAFCASRLRIGKDTTQFPSEQGNFVESAVVEEFQRVVSWSSTLLSVHHWRDNQKDEVDLVLERDDGAVVCVEVKGSVSLGKDVGRGIAAFRQHNPDRFHRGFVLHAGSRIEPLGDNVWAVPISVLWTVGESVFRPSTPSLADRVRAAKEAIEAKERSVANEMVRADLELTSLRMSAEGRVAALSNRLDQFGLLLRSVGLHTELGVIESGANPGVPWYWTQRLALEGPSGRGSVFLGARLLQGDTSSIEWLANVDIDTQSDDQVPNDRRSSDVLDDPLPWFERFLGTVADALPIIISVTGRYQNVD